jgi:L-lactate dehydrogenase complex protein LldG
VVDVAVSARTQILERVRAALADVPAGEPAAWRREDDGDPAVAYVRGRGGDPAALAALLARRCADYRATVTRCPEAPEEIRAAVRAAFERHEARAIVIAPGLQPAWIPAGVEAVSDDPPLALAELDRADGVLTGCAVAIAETGTVVLAGGPGQGRRALTLVPDLHVCVVAAAQIVPGVPDAISALAPDGGRPPPLTLISGPSATSDIELRRVEGVHGPRRLEIIIAANG